MAVEEEDGFVWIRPFLQFWSSKKVAVTFNDNVLAERGPELSTF